MGVPVDQTAPSDRRKVWIHQKQKSRSFDFSWRSGMWSPVDDRRKVLVVPLPAAPKSSAYRARLRPPPSMFQMDSGSSYESYEVADVRPSCDKPSLQRSKATAADDGLKPPPLCEGVVAGGAGEAESGRKAWIRQERRSHSLDSSLEESTSSSKGDSQFPQQMLPGRRCEEANCNISPTVKDKRLRLQQQRKSRSLDDYEQQPGWADDAIRRPQEMDRDVCNLSSRNPMLSMTASRKHFVRLQDSDHTQSRPRRRQLTVETFPIGSQRLKVVAREGLSPTQRGPAAVLGMKELSQRDKRATFADQKSFSCEVPSQQTKTDTACHRKQSEPTVAASSLQAPKSRGRLLPQLPIQGPELEKHINQVCCYNELVDLLQTQPSATAAVTSSNSQPPEIRISYGQLDSPQMSPGPSDSSTRNKRRCFAGQKSFSYEVNQYSKVVQDGADSATSVSERKHGSAPIVYQPVAKINRMRDYFDENEIEEFEIEPAKPNCATALRVGATDIAPYTATVGATRVCAVAGVTTGAAGRRLGFSNQRSLSCEQASLQSSRERRLSPEVKALAASAYSCYSQKTLVPEVTEDYKSYGARKSPTRELSPRAQRLRDVRRQDNLQQQQQRFSEDVLQIPQRSVKLELRNRQSSPAADPRMETLDVRISGQRLGKDEQVERLKDKHERYAKDEPIERLKIAQEKPARQEMPDRPKTTLERPSKEEPQPKFKVMPERHSGKNSITCVSGLRFERKPSAVESRLGSDPRKPTSLRPQAGSKTTEPVQNKLRDQRAAGRTQVLEMSQQEVQTTGDRVKRNSPTKDTGHWKANALEEDGTRNLQADRERSIQKENDRNGCHADRDKGCQAEQDRDSQQAEKERACQSDRSGAQERKASRPVSARPHFVEVSSSAESSDRTRRNEEKNVYDKDYADEFGELVSDGVVTWRRKSPEKRLVRGPDGRNALAGAVHLAKCHSVAEPGTCLTWLTRTSERTTNRADRREMFAQQKSVSCDTGADDVKDTEVLYRRQHQGPGPGHPSVTFAGMTVREKRLAMMESKKSYSVDELVHMQQLLNDGLIQPENLPQDLFIYQETLARRCQQGRDTTSRQEPVHTTPSRGSCAGQTRQKLLLLHSMKALHDQDEHGLEHPSAAEVAVENTTESPEGGSADSSTGSNLSGYSAGKPNQLDGQPDLRTGGNVLEHSKDVASGRTRKDFGSKLPLIRFLGKLMLDKKRNSRTGQK